MMASPGSKSNRANSPGQISIIILAGISLVSLSVLLLEIAFTRILSVIISYHYVFMVISMSLLGLGAGGIFSYFTRSKSGMTRLPFFGSLFSISIFLSVFGLAKISTGSVLINSFIIFVPFFLAGVILSRLVQEYAIFSGKIYAADISGAAAGALLAVPLLNLLGGINSGFFSGVTAAAGVILITLSLKTKLWLSAASLVLVISLFITSISLPAIGDIAFNPNLNKELVSGLSDYESGSRVVATRWSSFGRTDLVEFKDNPDVMTIYLDSTAGSAMYRFNGDINNPGPAVSGLKTDFTGYFPLRYLQPDQKDNALIIGPGGGQDVLVALLAGVRDITAVEVNPDAVEIVKEYSDYNGGIYTDFPNVKVITAEGRSYLRQQTEKYDLIMMTLAVTKTSRSPDGYALTENFLLTKESIADYLDHLTDNGRLVIVNHGPQETMRLMTLSHTVLENKGIAATEIMKRTYALASHHDSVFVLSKNDITPDESYLEHEVLHETPGMQSAISYLPYVEPVPVADHIEKQIFDQCQMLNPPLVAMGFGRFSNLDLIKGLATKNINVSVISDEKPFYYNFEMGIPRTLFFNLIFSIFFVWAVMLVPYFILKKRRNRKSSARNIGGFPYLFAALGIGFMLAEIPLIQRFTLFLGEPVLSISVLLFSLLLGAGIGGLTSTRLSSNGLPGKAGIIAVAVAVLLLLYAFFTPPILKQGLGLTLIGRSLISALMFLPLGFAMGFPFPLGIRLMQERGRENYIPWVWGINGSASVLGSVLAIILAMKAGFAWAMLVGAACYIIAWLALQNVPYATVAPEQKASEPVNISRKNNRGG